jgi:nucleotide-binding universal stress UspA family protein
VQSDGTARRTDDDHLRVHSEGVGVNGIVVGVDGSDESKQALRWALDEARLRHVPVRAVHVWIYPSLIGPGPFDPPSTLPIEQLRADAESLLQATVADVVGDAHDVEVEVRQEVIEGMPARGLLDAAEGADLLVVGSRGRGGFSGLLLGSVSQQCAHHATCPVVIVRAAHS